MPNVSLSERLYTEAKITAKAMNRSVPGQIEYWAKLGKTCEENPDLPVNFINDIFIGIAEVEAGDCSEYEFLPE